MASAHQDEGAGEAAIIQRRPGLRVIELQREFAIESRALAFQTMSAKFSAHEFNDLLDDGQTKPGSSEAPRNGWIGLTKAGEEVFQRLFRDANAGIVNGNANGGAVWGIAPALGAKRSGPAKSFTWTSTRT